MDEGLRPYPANTKAPQGSRLAGLFFDCSQDAIRLAIMGALKRLTWLLLVGVLLKLSMGPAMALPLMGVMGHAPIAALPPCHEATTAGHSAAHTAENKASQPAHPGVLHSTHGTAHPAKDHASGDKDPTRTACADCKMCCALGLLAVHQSLPPSAPAAAPQGVSPFWISQNLRPELPPPLL